MKILICALLAMVFTTNIPALADKRTFQTIEVSGAYAYATTSVQKNGAVFLHLKNGGDATQVTAARADVSEHVELHTHIMDGDMMMMREVEYYDVPTHSSIELEPMGHHIMLMGLKAPLKAGETFPLTLEFEEYGLLEVDVMIKNPGDTE